MTATHPHGVIPAQAGTHASLRYARTVAWISACAEMTVECDEAVRLFRAT